jgi:hypothetical protein
MGAEEASRVVRQGGLYMRVRPFARLVVAGTMAALALAAGCGGNDNKVTEVARTPTPVAPTPTLVLPTAVPTTSPSPAEGNQQVVTFTGTTSAAIQGFTLRVEYPVAKGGFAGSADAVECTSSVPGFTPNDRDDGTMLLVAGSASKLAFPVEITCKAVTGQALEVGDVRVVVQSLTENGAAGNTADLSVAVGMK